LNKPFILNQLKVQFNVILLVPVITEIDRQRQTDRQINIQREGDTARQKHLDRDTGGQTDRGRGREDRQTDRQTERERERADMSA